MKEEIESKKPDIKDELLLIAAERKKHDERRNETVFTETGRR